jgi:branched-chain amino acid transport system ATP-binding protein
VIQLDGLTVQLGGVRPIDALTVELDASVHGVVGPNGAGKTTLLNVLSGLISTVSGSFAVDGVPMERLSARRRALWGVRRTFQTERLAPQLSARDNVAVAADAMLPRRERARAIQRALDFTGVQTSDLPAVALDGFQRRLVEIARALVGRPRVVLLDEPASGLSGGESLHLEQLLGAVRSEYGAQVILVDHDVDLIARTCERVAVLDFGVLLAEGPTATVLQDEHVRAAWLGTAEVA